MKTVKQSSQFKKDLKRIQHNPNLDKPEPNKKKNCNLRYGFTYKYALWIYLQIYTKNTFMAY
jgi:hypothetical protein